MVARRAFPLSHGRRDLLTKMWLNRDTAKGELTCSVPGGWWLGNKRGSGNVCTWLLRYRLLRCKYTDAGNGGVGMDTIYVAAGEVGRLLNDLDYLPEGAVILQR